jgi:integrase
MKLRHTENGYVAHWTDHGRKRQRTLGFVTTDEAHRQVKIIAKGAPDIDLAEVLANLATDLSETTTKYRRLMLRRMIEAWGPVPVRTISADRARRFIAEMNVQPSTRCMYLTQCRQIFATLLESGHVLENPFAGIKVRVPRIERHDEYVRADLVMSLIRHSNTPSGVARCMALTRFAGLRLAEARRVKVSDITLGTDHDTIVVNHAGAVTTKRHRREVPITSQFRAAWPHLGVCAFEMTSHLVSGVTASRPLIDACRRAGVKPWPQPWHALRKSLESDWMQRFPVMDVCSWLGHSASVAAEHYHQTTPAIAKEVRA